MKDGLTSIRTRRRKSVACLALAALLGGCSMFPRLETGVAAPRGRIERVDSTQGRPLSGKDASRPSVNFLSPSQVVAADSQAGSLPAPSAEDVAALIADRRLEVSLPPQPLPQFIDTVFGGVLRVPYFTGPGIAQRRDIVTLRGSSAMSSQRLFDVVRTALAQYGVSVGIENGAVKVVESGGGATTNATAVLRARSAPEAPRSARPVIQYFELRALDVPSVMTLLSEAYPDRGGIRLTPREDINTIVMTGSQRDVASAATVLDQIDQPKFAGGQIARIEPTYWSAERLSQVLSETLATEGYKVAPEQNGPFALLPVPFTNQLLLFSNDPQAFNRALFWVRELDNPTALGDEETVFVYTVQNTSAAELGALVERVLEPQSAADRGGQTVRPAAGRTTLRRPASADGRDEEGAAPSPASNSRITVDTGGNRLLFRGSPSAFQQVRAIMAQLDSPPQQVLVEVTIAEVTLTDETRFGIDWYLQEAIGSAGVSLDTRGGSSREAGGLGATYSRIFSRGRVEAALNAIAQNRNLNILSTPRLVARSGSDAQILVGTDVPIITSQRAANNQTGGDTDILQTVQYRQTGVILNMRPVVYGDNRIDIELFQEVSSQEPNRTSSISSPLILNRSVTTQLSLREGMTAVIGGLIQDNYSRDQRGVPFLKDAPVLGSAFRTDSVAGTKVELLILITPYIMHTDDEMHDVANTYASAVNAALHARGPRVYTLAPWRTPGSRPVVHGPANAVGESPAAPPAQTE
ncbi:MAG: secretin N-terminal domain-containing protein [Hyphomonadaceae bacterium]|nr:secretin N-terminal domain-containing protein [Hyphomonadaceae bacterium]